MAPVSAIDVAAYILQQKGAMSAMKLQKLVYYAQAWSLVWDEKPLFAEEVRAWANGPVVRELYDAHRGQFEVRPGDVRGEPEKLSPAHRDTIDAVLRFYGDKSAQWLSDLTHHEGPWRDTRADHQLPDGERGNAVISHASMAEYYGSLSD